MRPRARLAIGLVAALLLLGAGDPPAPGKDRDLDEKTIYIPYKDLEKVFEAEGRGVFLPYPQFLELWTRARAAGAAAAPPVESVTSAGRYEGAVKDKVAQFQATLSFEVLGDGWSEIPLALGDLFLSEAKVEGEGAILRAGKDGYRLVVPGRGQYTLAVTFGVKVEERGGYRSIAFRTPRAAVSKLKVVIPGKDLEVTLEPNLAATIHEPDDADATEVLAFLGASDSIRVTWRPRARLTDPGEALISAEAIQRVSIQEGMVAAAADYSLNVLRVRVPEFALEFPKEFKVTALEGADIREWSVEDEADGRVVKVSLNRGVEGEYALRLEIERVIAGFPGDGATLEVPRIALRGARRERGVVALRLAPDLRAKVSTPDGATQIDVMDLPEADRDAAFAFRYPQHPFSIRTEVEKIQPRVRADALSLVSISEERIDVSVNYDLTIQRGGLFRVRLGLPEGYDFVDVSTSAGVRDRRVVATDDGDVLEVELPQRTVDRVRLGLTLERRRESAEGEVPLPFVRALDVIQESGLTGVSILESLKAVTKKTDGLVPRDIAEVAASGAPVPPDQVLTLAYSYQKQPVSATLDISRRESRVSVEVQTTLEAKEDVVKVTTVLRYRVRYAGVDRFRFTVPKRIGDQEVGGEKIHIQGADIKEKNLEAVEGEEGQPERVRHVVDLQRKALGEYALTIEYDLKLEKMGIGESVDVAIPELVVEDVFTEEGFIAARKSPNIVLDAKRAENLLPLDPSELPSSMRAADAFLAMQYVRHPVRLSLAVTRYDFQEIIPTLIEHIHTEVVLTKEGALRAESAFSLVNKQRQFLRVRLPEGAGEDLHVYVDGKEEQVAEEGGVTLIDLAKTRKQGEEILVWMRYDLPRTSKGGLGAMGSSRMPLPSIVGDSDTDTPPVARLTLSLFVPEGRRCLGFDTSMRRIDAPYTLWERVKRTLFGGPHRYGQAGWQAIRDGQALLGRAAPQDAGVAGRLAKLGDDYHFYKLDGDAVVSVRHVAGPLAATLDLGLFIAVIGAGIVLPRRRAISKSALVFGSAGAAVVLLTFLPEPFRPYLETVVLGSFVVGVLWAAHFFVTEWRRPSGDGPGWATMPPPAVPPPDPVAPVAPASPGAPADEESAGTEKPKPRSRRGRSSGKEDR